MLLLIPILVSFVVSAAQAKHLLVRLSTLCQRNYGFHMVVSDDIKKLVSLDLLCQIETIDAPTDEEAEETLNPGKILNLITIARIFPLTGPIFPEEGTSSEEGGLKGNIGGHGTGDYVSIISV